MTRSLNFQLVLRLSGVLLLILICLVLQGMWVKELFNDKARSTQLANAREHYAVVLAELDRRWGREAFNLKTRIEAQGFLEGAGLKNEKLLAYLTSQGSSIEFPALIIKNKGGDIVASYDYANHLKPDVKFMPGQVSTWTIDPADGHLYLVIRQFIWLGQENGYLTLFKPMDHALLTQITYPGTRLSLWLKGKAIASSDGDDGLKKTATSFPKPENSDSSAALTWSGPESETSPKLLVETLGGEFIGTASIALPVILVFLVVLSGVFIAFFTLWIKASRQFDALMLADQRYLALNMIDEQISQSLVIAQSGPVESARTLAESLERRINADKAQSPASQE